MSELETHSDDDLLRRMVAGDEGAFAGLYRRHQRAIYGFALQMSGSPSLAEEATQEVFMVLIQQAERYDSTRGSLSSYLYGVARNQVLRCLERDRPYVPMTDEDVSGVGGETAPDQSDPLGDLTRREQAEIIQQAILALPARYREVVVLCDLQELSYAEAARISECAVGTVRSRLHRARALLLKKLGAGRGAQHSAKDTRAARCAP